MLLFQVQKWWILLLALCLLMGTELSFADLPVVEEHSRRQIMARPGDQIVLKMLTQNAEDIVQWISNNKTLCRGVECSVDTKDWDEGDTVITAVAYNLEGSSSLQFVVRVSGEPRSVPRTIEPDIVAANFKRKDDEGNHVAQSLNGISYGFYPGEAFVFAKKGRQVKWQGRIRTGKSGILRLQSYLAHSIYLFPDSNVELKEDEHVDHLTLQKGGLRFRSVYEQDKPVHAKIGKHTVISKPYADFFVRRIGSDFEVQLFQGEIEVKEQTFKGPIIITSTGDEINASEIFADKKYLRVGSPEIFLFDPMLLWATGDQVPDAAFDLGTHPVFGLQKIAAKKEKAATDYLDAFKIYQVLRFDEDAVKAIEKAFELDPENIEVRENFAELLYASEDLQKAYEVIYPVRYHSPFLTTMICHKLKKVFCTNAFRTKVKDPEHYKILDQALPERHYDAEFSYLYGSHGRPMRGVDAEQSSGTSTLNLGLSYTPYVNASSKMALTYRVEQEKYAEASTVDRNMHNLNLAFTIFPVNPILQPAFSIGLLADIKVHTLSEKRALDQLSYEFNLYFPRLFMRPKLHYVSMKASDPFPEIEKEYSYYLSQAIDVENQGYQGTQWGLSLDLLRRKHHAVMMSYWMGSHTYDEALLGETATSKTSVSLSYLYERAKHEWGATWAYDSEAFSEAYASNHLGLQYTYLLWPSVSADLKLDYVSQSEWIDPTMETKSWMRYLAGIRLFY